ncbi:MAG: transketolase [Nitrospirales bacterium]|nr:transketolase [Nitrospirales bacterium]
MTEDTLLTVLQNKATELRIDSVRATSEAGSGHPTSCASAADIVATLFFSVMRYDPKNPKHPANDRFVLSKGHAAPLLYAAWAEVGLFDKKELLRLRTLDSDLEGHPTPRLPFVDVATGSLGQGLSAGVGMALNAKRLDRSPARIYVLMGDGESAEGSVWEAAEIGRHYGLDNLCAIIDVNRLGQSDPTMLQHDMEAYRARWSGFGWHAIVVDGHDIAKLLAAFEEAAFTKGTPTIILARTLKGKGLSSIEDQPDWHGKPLKKGEQTDKAIEALTRQLRQTSAQPDIQRPDAWTNGKRPTKPMAPPNYKTTDSVATREAFGTALAALGEANPLVVGLDADVKNSTFTDKFGKQFPDRFFENFIAEQNMVGASAGLAACGKIPFAATFACFLTRAYDFIRMAAISQNNIKLMGSHVGVSIGEDGPSQMGLEDLAMMSAQPGIVVLYPSDAVCTHRLVELMAAHQGPAYIRTGRPKAPILYTNDETFTLGGSKVLRQSASDRLTIVAAGVTLFEALKAYDQLKVQSIAVRVIDLYSIVPIDRAGLIEHARATQGLVLTVEDHYAHGGLGDAVLGAVGEEGFRVHKIAVREIPHSGKPDELIDRYGISARAIVETVKRML